MGAGQVKDRNALPVECSEGWSEHLVLGLGGCKALGLEASYHFSLPNVADGVQNCKTVRRCLINLKICKLNKKETLTQGPPEVDT